MVSKSFLLKNKVYIFVLTLFIIWVLRQYLYVTVDQSLSGLVKTAFGIIVKGIIWIGLSFIFYKEKLKNVFTLTNIRKGITYSFLFGLILLLSNFVFNYLLHKDLLNINISFSGILSAVIFAPIIEEVVFRGVILKEFGVKFNFFSANTITSMLFLLIHFPGWIIWGEGISVVPSVSIFLVSLVFGFLYYKTKSIHSPILAHSINNLISMLV